ncbi:hypothetical protein [Paenibacillus sp. IITD108]|uniref:hypothetical protein n=1 Tax=Paenibacillus sp. IITD108 TaxID=3116649 RepID=UPI002F419C15
MKIKTAVLIIGLIIAGIYIYADNTVEKAATISADHIIFETYDDALKYSDIVLEVTATENFKNIINKNSGYSTGYTASEVEINKVFENRHKEQGGILLKEGEIIKILEPTYTVSNGIAPGVTRFNYEDYIKMEPQRKYVLFLKWDDKRKAYWVNSLEQGKFNVDNTDKRELLMSSGNTQYEKLKKDVMDHLYP